MSNDEIIAYLSLHTDVCGRMRGTQIAGINQSLVKPVKRISNFLNYRVAALVAGVLAFTRAEAENKELSSFYFNY